MHRLVAGFLPRRHAMTGAAMTIGIVGAGGVSEASHVPILSQTPGVRLAWLCDLDHQRAARLGRDWGVPQSYDDIRSCPDVDAVLVAIPVGRRKETLATVFARRWHALVEKPFAVTAAEHRTIVDEAARAGVEIGVGLMRRLYRSTTLARLTLAAGVFGPVQEVWASEAARMGTTGREGAWYQADPAAAGGGVLIETGSHLIDQVFHALGVDSFDGLQARFTEADGIDFEARAMARIRCACARDPVPLHLVISRARDLYTGVVIRCRDATLRFGVAPDAVVEVLGPDERPLCRLERAIGATNLHQAFFQEWQVFLDQCRTRKPSALDAASALTATRFIEAAYNCNNRRTA
jgi:predicted dehydrogenase